MEGQVTINLEDFLKLKEKSSKYDTANFKYEEICRELIKGFEKIYDHLELSNDEKAEKFNEVWTIIADALSEWYG